MAFGQTYFIEAPFLYVNGMQLAWASETSLFLSPGLARDSTNSFDISLNNPTTVINAQNNGVNGLDVGSLSLNTC